MGQRAYRHHRSQFRHLPQFRRFHRMPQFRMVAMTRWLNQTVRQPVAPINFLPNIATAYLQARSVVDKVTAPLPVPPELVNVIPDLVHAILDPLVGKGTPKAREEPLDVVKLVVPGKRLRAEGAVEAGGDEGSEDSSSQAEASTSPAAGSQGAPVASNPPAGCPSQPSPPSGPVGQQEPGASNGESGANLGPDPPASSPPPLAPSASGADVGAVSAGAGVGCSG